MPPPPWQRGEKRDGLGLRSMKTQARGDCRSDNATDDHRCLVELALFLALCVDEPMRSHPSLCHGSFCFPAFPFDSQHSSLVRAIRLSSHGARCFWRGPRRVAGLPSPRPCSPWCPASADQRVWSLPAESWSWGTGSGNRALGSSLSVCALQRVLSCEAPRPPASLCNAGGSGVPGVPHSSLNL